MRVDTFERSKPAPDPSASPANAALYRRLLDIRRHEIVPRLKGARALDARALGSAAVMARWRMGDSALLTHACNLGAEAVEIPRLAGRAAVCEPMRRATARRPVSCRAIRPWRCWDRT